MIHDVVAELARIVAEAIREAARVEFSMMYAEPSAEAHRKTILAKYSVCLPRLGVEHAHAGGLALVLVVDQLVDDLVGPSVMLPVRFAPTAASPRRC